MVALNQQSSSGLRVLIVDDDKNMAEYLSDLLISIDCETNIFNDSRAALDEFKIKLDDYDLVVSDVCMPNITGDFLAEEILNIRPDMNIVLCSGYAPHVDKQKLLDMGVKAFMEKPINSSKLVQIVNELKVN